MAIAYNQMEVHAYSYWKACCSIHLVINNIKYLYFCRNISTATQF